MRFAQVHKFAVYTLAVLGLVALGAGGELPPISVLLVVVGVAASWFAEGAILHDERYVRAWNVTLVLGLAAQLARAFLFGTDFLLAIVEFAALFQVSLLSNRRSAMNYQYVTVLSLLFLIAATVLGGGLSYAVCFVGFVIATPWAMTLGHLRREIEGNYLADARAGRAGVPIDVARILRSRRVVGAGLLAGSSLLAVPIFLLTAVIFVLFPRIGLGMLTFRRGGENVVAGFGTTVDLSGHGTIRNDPTIVLRVEPPDLTEDPPPVRSFRLRGASFDTYNGRAWSRRSANNHARRLDREGDRYAFTRAPDPAHDQPYRVVLDPLEPPVLFVPEGAVGFTIPARFESGFPRYTDLNADRDDGVRYAGNEGVGLIYTAWVPRGADATLPRRYDERAERFARRYTQLPDALSPEVRALAERVTARASTPLEKARAVERFLLSGYRYTLRLESGAAERPLEDFLFRTRAGHCEYFSTAMAVMLRTVGVPTRNVTGFLGGTWNRYGRFYAVHQGDAHSWVEVYDPSVGWATFDPTPPAAIVGLRRRGLLAEADALVEAMRMRWRHYVVGFDLSTQAQMARRAWRTFERYRGRNNRLSSAIQQRGERATEGATRVPWKRYVGLALAVVVFAALLSQLRAIARAVSEGGARPRSPAVRAAHELARALDQSLAAMGHHRPSSRSPSAFAADLVKRGAPAGALATRVAARYNEARWGERPLDEAELEALKRELREAARPEAVA